MSAGRPAWAETPYVRIYSSIPRDYPDVWHDASALGTYVQLLHLADGQYPAPPPLPRRIDDRSLGVLVTAGLIRVRDDDTFEVAGLRAEREGRVSGRRAGGLARAAVAERGNDGRFRSHPGDGGQDAGNAGDAGSDAGPAGSWPVAGVQHHQVSRAEPSQASRAPARAREGLPNLSPEAIAGLEQRTGQPWSLAGDRQLGEYDRLIGAHGLEATLAAFDAVSAGKRMTARQLVWPAMKLLEPFPNTKDTKAADAEERERIRHRRSVENTIREAHYAHDKPDPRCTLCKERT